MISKSTIAQIMDSIDIIDVINDFTALKKKGQNYWACCPFHNEKTPSFSVSPQKQIYKCFGCGKAGDAVKFVRDHEGFSYVEALKYLAGKYNIVVEEEETTEEFKENQSKRESLLIVLNYAKDYFVNNLKNSEEGKSIGLSYFRERGFSDKIINDFELGYSFDSWDKFSKEAVAKGYNPEYLVETGICSKKENGGLIDLYRGRVIFPIHNLAGKVVGFGGRTLKSNAKEAKYINTKETDVYSKRKILYGAYQSKNNIRNEDECYLVEGYTDVISLHQGGVNNVVASSGTSLTEDQIRLIRRYTKNITFLFDGDEAGLKAALRGLDMVLAEGMNVQVVIFPEGEDPDSYIRKVGGAEFKEYISSSKTDFITFKSNVFLKEAGEDPVKKANAIKEVVRSLARIDDKITREVFCKKTALLFEFPEETVISEVNKIKIQDYKQRKKDSEKDQVEELEQVEAARVVKQEKSITREEIIQEQERELVRFLLKYSNENIDEEENIASFLLKSIDDIEIQSRTCMFIINEYRQSLKSGEMLSPNYFFQFDDDGVKDTVVDLVMDRYRLDQWHKFEIDVPKEEDNVKKGLFQCLLLLKWKNIKLLIKQQDERLKHLKDGDVEEVDEILKYKMQLKAADAQIGNEFGNVISF